MKICPKCGYSMMFYYLNYDVNKRVYECTHCKYQEVICEDNENKRPNEQCFEDMGW